MPKTNSPAATATLKAFIVPPVSHSSVFLNYCFAGQESQLVLSSVSVAGERHFASSHSQARTRPTLKNIGIVRTSRSVARLLAPRDTSQWSMYASPAEKDKQYLRRPSPRSLFVLHRTQVLASVHSAGDRSL